MSGDVLEAFADVKATGADQYSAKCPAHDDHRSSLSISRGADGRWLLTCHAGCTLSAILDAAHLTTKDLFPTRNGHQNRRIVATYGYTDERGQLLYEVCRFQPKDFRQRAADGSWSVKNVRKVLYRLPQLQRKPSVLIVEGEKDADRLCALGLTATTNAGGAGKWKLDYVTQLQTAGCRHVRVIPDNDPPGLTHAREIARSCQAAGLDVTLITLPDLPEKGDVSDYLERHTVAELATIIEQSPRFSPAQPVATPPALELTTIADFLNEPEEAIEWLVDPIIPAGAIVLLPAPPKAGKSTLARELAHAVATGTLFLGWETTAGAVWYFALEDKRAEVRRHFRRLGATLDEPLRLFVGQAPADLLDRLHALAALDRPILIVVDILARALKVKDFNDYAEVTRAFEPLLKLSRDTGATLLLLHHASAHMQREGLDAVLGSTALSGSVDNILLLKRDGDQRVLSSVQRIGADLTPTVIVRNDAGRLERAGTKQQYDDAELGRQILAVLATATEPLTEKQILAHVNGRGEDKSRALRLELNAAKTIVRSGGGKRGDPYVYGRADSHSQNSGRSNEVAITREGEKAEIRSINPGLFDAPEILTPDPLSICREGESRTYVRGDRHHVEKLLPETPQIEHGDPTKTAETTDKHCSDSPSRDSEIVEEEL